jgi:hypothetical protein
MPASLPSSAIGPVTVACDGVSHLAVGLAVIVSVLCVVAFTWILGTIIWDDIRTRTVHRRTEDRADGPLF